MATTTLHNGTGAQTSFLINYLYLSEDFVVVKVADVTQTIVTHYVFSSDGLSIEFVSAPASGTNNVSFERVTSATPLVDFVKGGAVSEANLDDATQQAIHIAEEDRNNFTASTFGLSGGHWDAESLRIVNLAAPVADTDAATKASIAAQVTAAELAETNAETAETNAETAETNAETAQTAAETAQTAAELAETNITAVYPVSSLVVGEQLFATSTTAFTSTVSRGPQLISEIVISAQASAIFALGTAYSRYIVDLENVLMASDALNLEMTISDDAQVSYESAGYDTHGFIRKGGTASWAALNAAEFTLHDPTEAVGTAAGELPITGMLEFLPGDGTNGMRMTGRTSHHATDGVWTVCLFDAFNDTTVVRATHIKFIAESGNLTSGRIRLWGIV
ncbi:MAG: phage tail fiber protein [Dehalococcoidia bacterium]